MPCSISIFTRCQEIFSDRNGADLKSQMSQPGTLFFVSLSGNEKRSRRHCRTSGSGCCHHEARVGRCVFFDTSDNSMAANYTPVRSIPMANPMAESARRKTALCRGTVFHYYSTYRLYYIFTSIPINPIYACEENEPSQSGSGTVIAKVSQKYLSSLLSATAIVCLDRVKLGLDIARGRC